ncbi:MAG: globin [Bacteroidales bacterium]|nr:globin [Bacteroidales bacterium]
MQLNILPFDGQRPKPMLPSRDFLETLTEEGLRKLISDHYNLLVKSEIKNLFPTTEEELEKAKRNAADFFIQICGGPKYYNENRGNPMMVKRHEPFHITPSARVVWLQQYQKLLLQLSIPDNLILEYWNYINVFSTWMVNSNEPIKLNIKLY